MTRFLASVRDLPEARLALAAGADIIDLKEPAAGALGAVSAATLRSVVQAVDGRRPVSATIGDVPMQPGRIAQAVRARAETGVDFVKFGIFAGGDPEASIGAAAVEATACRAALIAVAFADELPGFDWIGTAAEAGLAGVMVDTRRKGSGPLTRHLDMEALHDIVGRAKASGLLVGLAGSLWAEDVPPLLGLEPDLLGFRGALCESGERTGGLGTAACRKIRALIPQGSDNRQPEPPLRQAAASPIC